MGGKKGIIEIISELLEGSTGGRKKLSQKILWSLGALKGRKALGKNHGQSPEKVPGFC